MRIQNESLRIQVAVYRIKIQIIQQVTANFYKLSVKDLQQHTRHAPTVRARRAIHFLCREFMPKCTLTAIGLLTGNGQAFHHASVIHSIKKMSSEMSIKDRSGRLIYPEIESEMNQLRVLIRQAFRRDLWKCEKGATILAARAKRIKYHFRAMYHKSRLFSLKLV